MPHISAFLSAAAVLALCASAACGPEVLRYDEGSGNLSTVIGLYADNGLRYHQRVDFTIQAVQAVRSPKVLLHVHVGSEIAPVHGESEARLGVRVNGGLWHWKALKDYADNGEHWVEIPVPASELRSGLNRVETSSTVASHGNLTPRSVDILASRATGAFTRSWHTHDFKHYRQMPDRNWGIRMEYERDSAESRPAISLKITPDARTIAMGERAQFALEARDKNGALVDAGGVRWSASRGSIDEWGLFAPSVSGETEITAKVGRLTARATCGVVCRPPAGVEAPDSDRRLKPTAPEGHLDLTGRWLFRLDPDNTGEGAAWFGKMRAADWGEIHVPGCWQAQGYGMDYHGVGWYRRDLRIPSDWSDRQVWLRFDAVATHARVWVNGQLAGEHLGDWSPFDVRVTDFVRTGRTNTVVVRVEEMPQHFSAGFLPVIAPHFGGIWQPVSAFATGEARLHDVFVDADASGRVTVEATVRGACQGSRVLVTVTGPDGREVARAERVVSASGDWASPVVEKLALRVPGPRLWSPEDPVLYTARVEVHADGAVSDSRRQKFGFRSAEIRGRHLLLNGKPIFARGILHWGYYPDLVSIDPSEERIRKEFEDLKAAGFNTVKCCLFFMPKRFYEIADETGMLIWQEYPVWLTFPKDNESGDRPEIEREFEEWFRFDRNHPSVILRSFTCEAPSMEKGLTERLYTRAKSMTGGELIEDNSAYLNQQFTDWYDCHMYCEVDSFAGLWTDHWRPAMQSRGEKPFIPGEDLDYDSYRDTAAVRGGLVRDGVEPWWIATDAGFQLQERTEQEFARQFGGGWPSEMRWRQNRHVLAVRKTQMEDYRKQPEFAGHMMTGVRDNLHTRCGFFDDLDQPKWSPSETRAFLGETILMLESPKQSRCFRFDEKPVLEVMVSNYGEPIEAEPLRWRLMSGANVLAQGEATVSAERGAVATLHEIPISVPGSSHPVQCRLVVELGESGSRARNDWPMWFFPEAAADGKQGGSKVYAYSPSGADAMVGDLAGLPAIAVTCDGKGNWSTGSAGVVDLLSPGTVLVTDSLDESVRAALQGGANVLYLAPDGDKSLPRRQAPFWREMAIWLPSGHPALGDFPHEGFVDLQFAEMTQREPFDTSAFRSSISPIVWAVNARYFGGSLMIVDYVFEAGVGKGNLLACCLNLRGSQNVAGNHLLRNLVNYAAGAGSRPSVGGHMDALPQ